MASRRRPSNTIPSQLGLFELLGEPSKGQLNYWILVCNGNPPDVPFPLPHFDFSFPCILFCFSESGFIVGRLDLPDADKTTVLAYDIHTVIHLSGTNISTLM